MAIDYSALNWADLVAQAQADRQRQLNGSDSFDPFSGASTTIGGLSAQTYLLDPSTLSRETLGKLGYAAPRAGEAPEDWNAWDHASFNIDDPSGPEGQMTRLYRNADGSVGVGHYAKEDNFLRDMAMFALAATGMNYGLGALAGTGAGTAAGAGAATSGASAAGTGAAGAGALEAGTVALPAGGMASTGTLGAAPWAAGAGELGALGTGTYGATTAGVGSAMGTTGGAMGLGSGMAGVTSANLAAAGAGGGMWEGLVDKAIDFGTSKVGSSLIGAGISALSGANQPNSTTSTSTMQLDPRMANILYGANGNNGLLSQIMANQSKPQNAGMQQFGNGMDQYLKDWGTDNFMRSQQAAQQLQSSNIAAPTMGAASAQAAQVNAPSQNNLDLSSAYQQMIYGDSAQNPYLQGALQKGVNQANTAFQNMATDYTKSFQDALGGIRGGAVLNNTMGSSRQGIAEGKAMDSYNTQMGRALSQYGQNVTDTILGAQAGAYENGQNRALSAMSGLGAQQYGVAQQNAAMQQQANLANAGFQQQANQSNLQSQLSTNQLNSQNQTAGIGLSSGLLGQAAGYGQAQDAYAGNKLGQTAGLLSPFTGYGATTSQTTPLYNNTAGNLLGGALAGATLWNAFNQPQKTS